MEIFFLFPPMRLTLFLRLTSKIILKNKSFSWWEPGLRISHSHWWEPGLKKRQTDKKKQRNKETSKSADKIKLVEKLSAI